MACVLVHTIDLHVCLKRYPTQQVCTLIISAAFCPTLTSIRDQTMIVIYLSQVRMQALGKP